MGNSAPSASHDEYDDHDYAEQFDGVETLGYRVLGVQPNSPASQAGLVSFFDFIVGANEQMLLGSGEGLEEGEEYDDVDFPALLRENIGQKVELLVWNIKAQEKRVVELIPRDDWGGAGLLGVTIKLDDYGGADERLVRVLEVEEHSPAAVVGLVPEQDFLLGTTACALKSADVLAAVLMENIDRVIELYVYNSTTDIVRVVGLLPTYSWGEHNSLLGAEVGTGYLHRLPTSCRGTIGQSIERKVQLIQSDGGDDSDLNQHTIQMEPHLEMEIDEDDEDIGCRTAASTKQPHQLGTPDRDIMAGSLETHESMRSISLISEIEGEETVEQEVLSSEPTMMESQQQQTTTQYTAELVGAEMNDRITTESHSETNTNPHQESTSLPPFPEAAAVKTEATIPPPPPPPAVLPPPPPVPSQSVEMVLPTPPPPLPTAVQLVEKDDEVVAEPEESGEGNSAEEEDSEYETESEEEEEEEDEEGASAKKSGFFSSFMPAPPKMRY
ncbi:GRASP55/65 PDZ-like domain containing protein [Nitzschia inconspicua]|uniref:GRASP55/65 PDZ-like domain containing protein n=1 Tax=Nitzschia inconspicua TaxID=303405 RepID=A0A9K3LV35_9STRA|nr:GRASP55/65 PDZ-like domain containing protein [Nitzschia inconspicua]